MKKYLALAVMAMVSVSAVATADMLGPYTSNTAQFTSDLEGDLVVSVPAFNLSAPYVLDSVTVNLKHSASVDIAADNDDPLNEADVNARMIRTFFATGPGVNGFGTKTIASNIIHLGVDDNDGGDNDVFDPTANDGVDFGELNYTDLLAGSYSPAPAAYIGSGDIDFTIDVETMVNDLQFTGASSDAWQMEVENPLLTVWVEVTYNYTPEPASLALLSIGGLVVLRRRR